MHVFQIQIAAAIASCCLGAMALPAQETPPVPKPEASAESAAPAEEPELLEKKEAPPATAPVKPSSADAEKTEPAEPPKPAATKKSTNLTEDILEGLGLTGEQAAGNPLDAIVERMRSVQQRLQKTETDQETRQLQTQIVKDLDELIEKLKNQKPPPPPKSDQNQPPPPPMGNPPPDGAPRGGQPKPQNSQKQRGGSDQQQQQKPKPEPQSAGEKKPSGDKSRDSDQQANRGRSAEEEAARQRLAKDVWGHLPAAMRQDLLNVYSEKFLPKYDDLVRKYYEALAEQNRRNP